MADDPQPGLAPRDRDAMIRTVLTEAASNDPMGWAAVASTIRNRLAAGKYGDTPAAVVTAPNQFEVWSNGRAQKEGGPSNPNYEAAGRIVDAVAQGLPDPTTGATHFYSPSGQAAMGRSAPGWGKNPIANIGGQLFFAPQGAVTFSGAPAAIDQATSGKQSVASPDEIFKRWGVDAPDTGKSTPAPAKDGSGDVFKRWGVELPDASKAASEPPQGAAKAASLAVPPGDAAAAIGSGIGDLPIVGPYVKEGMIRGAAAIGSVVNPALGLPAPSADQIRQWDAQLKQEHPVAYGGGRVLGAGATLGAGAAMGGARVLGMAGNMIPRIGYGAVSGGAIGAGDAYTHGENPLVGGGLGALGGGVAAPLGALTGMGVNQLVRGAQYLMPTGVSGVSRPAANIAATVLNADDPTAIRAILTQHGPLAMLADAGPSTNALTAGLALKPSEAKTVVTNAINARAAGRDARLTGDIDAALGPAPVPSRVEAGLAASRDALGPEYEQAFQGARAVNTEPLANTLDASVANLRGPAQDAVRRVRGYLNIPGTDQLDPHPRALMATRNAIDGLLTNEDNPQVIRQLSAARQQVDNELGRAVPGIKDVDAKFAELSRQSEALDQGSRVLDSGKTAVRPQDLAESFPASANPQGTLVGPSAVPLRTQQGVRAEIDRQVGTKSNDLVALRNVLQGEGGWNTNKLTTVFGEEPTNRLLGAVSREAAFDNTTNEVLRNSATARRTAAGKLLDDTEPGSLNLIPASATGLALQAGKKMLLDPLMHMLTVSPSAPRNLELARIMTAQGATRDQILDQLLRLNARQQAISNTGNMLAGITSGTSNRLLAGAGATQRP